MLGQCWFHLISLKILKLRAKKKRFNARAVNFFRRKLLLKSSKRALNLTTSPTFCFFKWCAGCKKIRAHLKRKVKFAHLSDFRSTFSRFWVPIPHCNRRIFSSEKRNFFHALFVLQTEMNCLPSGVHRILLMGLECATHVARASMLLQSEKMQGHR